MQALTGAKAGNSANELALPFVSKSQAKQFEGKSMAKPENQVASQNMRNNTSANVSLTITTDKAASLKRYREQVVKPMLQALFAGEKTPEAVADEFKSKGAQLLK